MSRGEPLAEPFAAAPPAPVRLRSLDVFRGATIALMILVNNPGDWTTTYWPLLHAPWHGWTPTDLVFPFFLFIVGVAIAFALPPRDGLAAPPPGVARKIVRRSAILFGLGLLGTFFPFYTVVLERVRIPGVLQRIAVVYLVASFAYLWLRPRGRAVLAGLLLAGYWAAMKLVPVPGFGAGDLSPQGNLAFWLDHQLLGAHTWRYSPGPGDPEGLLSTLPAIVTALAGIFAGEWLRARPAERASPAKAIAAGAALLVAGLALSPLFPINKNLWSPTYTLFTAGAAWLLLLATWWSVDVRGWRGWISPFEIFGRNSILAFVGSGLLAKLLITVIKVGEGTDRVPLQKWLYLRLLASWLPPNFASLAWALAIVALWLAILALLDRRGIHLKV